MKNIAISALLNLLIVNAVERSTQGVRRSINSGSNAPFNVNDTRFSGEHQRVNANEIFAKRKSSRAGQLELSDLSGINFRIGKIVDLYSSDAFGKRFVRGLKTKNVLSLAKQPEARTSLKRLRKDIEGENRNKTRENVGCKGASLSCRDCCAQNRDNCTKDAMPCRCDPQCAFYNDCCADYETFCGKKQISFPISQGVMSCIFSSHVDMKSEFREFWVVNKCPKDRHSDGASRKCAIADETTMNAENLRTLVPVVGENNLTFRNEFCAKCNGIATRDYFGIDLKCFVNPPSSISSLAEMLKFASKYCNLEKIFRKDDQFVRECNQESNLQRCDQRSSKLPGESHEDGSKMQGPVGSVLLPVPSFTLVLRLSKGTFVSEMHTPKCPTHEGEFYDSYLETCRAGEPISPPVQQNLDKFDVVVWINVNEMRIFPALNEIASSLTQTFNLERSQMNALQYIPVKSSQRRKYMIIRFTLRLTSEQTLSLGKANHTTSSMKSPSKNDSRTVNSVLPLRRLLFFSGEFNMTLSEKIHSSSNSTLNVVAIITVFKTTSRPLACIRKQTYSYGAYTSVENGKYYYINSTGKTFAKNKVFFENESISVCEQIVFSNCVGMRVNLTSEEYVKFDNLSIFYNRTNTVYDFGEYDIENGEIFMCVPRVLRKIIFWTSKNGWVVETYLTIICLCLSLACLYLVIQTYLVFPELRNLPGKNLLSLSISLFLAQLLWLIPDRHYPSTICHIAAIVKHYLFLVSFVAMAAIAWHTNAVFVSKHVGQMPSAKNRDRRKFYKYSAIVWGLPAIFVITCAVVEKKDIYAVYVNEVWCWFDNEQAQSYLFILPVGLLQLFNIIFFALTVFRIYRVRSSTRSVCGSVQSHKTLLWIYLKLSSLMGFSWLFGFIYLLVEHPAFSYLFVILASLQGVYIAVAFVMKKTIWRKYMRLLGRKTYIPDYRCTLLENLHNSRETRV